MHSDGSGQASYWPAFVDALTNVVINLLFLMGLMALAFFVVSVQVEAARMAALQAKAPKPVPKAPAAPKPVPTPPVPLVRPAPVQPMPAELAAAAAQLPWAPFKTWVVAKSQGEQADEAAVRVVKPRPQGAGLRGQLVFAAHQLAPSLPAQLLAPWTQGHAASDLRWRLSARFETGNTNSRRSAYLRLMAVRNTLLAQGVVADAVELDLQDSGRAGLDDRKVDVLAEPISAGNGGLSKESNT